MLKSLKLVHATAESKSRIKVHVCVCTFVSPQQKFGIKTAGLEDKCTAMQMLVVYAKDLKEGFADFAEPVRFKSCLFALSCALLR